MLIALLVQIISWNNHYSDYSLKFDDYSLRIVVFHVIDNEKLIEPAFAMSIHVISMKFSFVAIIIARIPKFNRIFIYLIARDSWY